MLLAAGMTLSCGKSSESEKTKDTEAKTEVGVETDVVEEALSVEDAPFKDVLARAGYEPVSFSRIPAPVPGKKGSVLLYKTQGKGNDGGMLYFEQRGDVYSLVWHWYFDWVPASAEPVEINEDGLWDLRVISKSGDVVDLIHEESFTLFGGDRDGRAALNCVSSPPADPESPFWVCFDGDTATAWTSAIGTKDKAFIEWHTPFGLTDGILTVRAMAGNEPRDCEIRADGEVVQHFALEQTGDEQVVQLDPRVRTAKTVRLTVASSFGQESAVSITELGIK